MKYLPKVWIFLFLLSSTACEQIEKQQYAEQVAQKSCEEINKTLIEQASSLVPVVGLTEALVPEDIKKGSLCDCLKPTLQEELQDVYTPEELKAMTEEKAKRIKVATNIIFKHNREILKCYEAKGLEGLKIIEKFFEKLIKKTDETL